MTCPNTQPPYRFIFPPRACEERFSDYFTFSGLSTRHLPSSEKDQEFDILNPKQLLPGLLQICGSAACNEVHGEWKAILILVWLHYEEKYAAPKKVWSILYAMENFKNPRDYQSQFPSTDGETEVGGMGRKEGQKLCQWHIASWPIEEWSFPRPPDSHALPFAISMHQGS